MCTCVYVCVKFGDLIRDGDEWIKSGFQDEGHLRVVEGADEETYSTCLFNIWS